MASTFAFGFSGDDIDDDLDADADYVDDEMQIDSTEDIQQGEQQPEFVSLQKHSLSGIVRIFSLHLCKSFMLWMGALLIRSLTLCWLDFSLL